MSGPESIPLTRRCAIAGGTGLLIAATTPLLTAPGLRAETSPSIKGPQTMTYISAEDGTQIFYRDWGPRDAQPIVFHHGWPLTADEWDAQMLYFLGKGFRVIAFDRRGHGRSDQTETGNEMDTYASDVIALADALDLKAAVHVGHSTGGGEVVHYAARAKPGRVSKLVLIGAVPPVMVKKDSNPDGTPLDVFDGFRQALLANRPQFYLDVASGPFYGFNRPDAEVSEGLIRNWWRQGMQGSAKAHYDCIEAFSETDFTEDLKAIQLPTLVMHGSDDQVVTIKSSASRTVEIMPNATLKVYDGASHGMAATMAEAINADILGYLQSS
ncbi:Non-heme chloroperoxidase [Roseovarius sp. THAF8]|nr:alpha/beta hydrolase [Roseovarius sp. THAF8]QFT97907.1 Non-heme chloroperoxidase [Roseovarius sp. THAF8]